MGKCSKNLLLRHTAGVIGKQQYVKSHGDDEFLILSCPDRSKHVKTPAEKANQDKFNQARRYASAVIKDPERKAFYTPFRLKKRTVTEFNWAVKDFMIGPEILDFNLEGFFGKPGDRILINARDNVKVTRVDCILFHADNTIAEHITAGYGDVDKSWVAICTRAYPDFRSMSIEITAFDQAGNTAIVASAVTRL